MIHIGGIERIEYAPASKTISVKNKGRKYARPFYTTKQVAILLIWKTQLDESEDAFQGPTTYGFFSPFKAVSS